MSQAFYLYQLQKIDTYLLNIDKRLDEINRLINNDTELKTAETSLKTTKASLDISLKQQRNIEDRIETLKIKITTEEASLYSGRIQSPKELQDIQNEIASLNKQTTSLEDQLLDVMVANENTQADYKIIGVNLDNIRAKNIEEKASLLGEQAQLEKQVEKLNFERQVAITSVTDENLVLYNRLKKQKRGIAVTLVEDLTCTACGVEIRPAERQEARSPNKIICCQSCGRILYTE
jgi:predicted  nucleic acid-binding Zn-ribbon protein